MISFKSEKLNADIFQCSYEHALSHINKLFSQKPKNNKIFITGPAGVGKSTLTNQLIQSLQEQGQRVLITASTGIAGILINGQTIHKALGFGICNNIQQWENYMSKQEPYVWANLMRSVKGFDTLIIDEISMISAQTLQLIDYIIKITSKNHEFSFGFKNVILVGDPLQLSPVIKKDDFYQDDQDTQNKWFFQADCFKKGDFKIYYLNEVLRQKDQAFTNFLNKTRVGTIDTESIKYMSYLATPKQFESKTRPLLLVPTNNQADAYSKTIIEKIPTKEYNFKAKINGISQTRINQIIKSCPAKENLILKETMRVICLKNDTHGLYVNGSLGTIKKIHYDQNQPTKSVITVVFDNNNTVDLEYCGWEIHNPKHEPIASMQQIPLLPAYALSIHRCQGMTLEQLVLDCNRIFSPAQLYVGLSRCTKPEFIQTYNIHHKYIMTDKVAIDFMNEVSKML